MNRNVKICITTKKIQMVSSCVRTSIVKEGKVNIDQYIGIEGVRLPEAFNSDTKTGNSCLVYEIHM